MSKKIKMLDGDAWIAVDKRLINDLKAERDRYKAAIEGVISDMNRVIDPNFTPENQTVYSIILFGSTILKLREALENKE